MDTPATHDVAELDQNEIGGGESLEKPEPEGMEGRRKRHKPPIRTRRRGRPHMPRR